MKENDRQNFSILLVEKDLDYLHLVKKSLEENSRFPSTVDHAASIREALEKIKKKAYHLLLVESELEEEKGLKLLEKINRNHLQLPFILMTPIRDDQLVREAIRQGVADLIVKSEYQFQELAEKLRKCYSKFHEGHSKGRVSNRRFAESSRLDEEAAPPKIQLSIHDELTGLYNHSYLHERVVREFSGASRYSYPLSCLLIDIDHFRTMNEKYGYRTGEDILKQCGALLFESCRLSDFIARFGGEEFAVILPHINYKNAKELAHRLRKIFAEHRFLVEGGEIPLTVSIGVSSYPEDEMKNRSELISFANQALLYSKAIGRNAVTLYKDIMPVFEESFPILKISEEKVIDFQRRMGEISNTARRAYIEASKALIIALETKDRFTAGHAASVAKYSLQVAEALGMSVDEAEVVQHAALLHDVGKICIPDHVLLKPARLSILEYEAMKEHPYLGYKILKPIKFLQQEAVLVLHHHEWFNGEGYPCRLKGNEIPLGARIISVIDAYDTMRIAGGRYKKTFDVQAAVNELIAYAGVQFDPQVVMAFLEVLKERGELKEGQANKSRLEEILKAVS